jgi:hypothetical protein
LLVPILPYCFFCSNKSNQKAIWDRSSKVEMLNKHFLLLSCRRVNTVKKLDQFCWLRFLRFSTSISVALMTPIKRQSEIAARR